MDLKAIVTQELASITAQEAEHRLLAERAAGAKQALAFVLAQMEQDDDSVQPFPVAVS